MWNSRSDVDEQRFESDRTVIRKYERAINRPVDRDGITGKARSRIFTRRAHWLVLRRGSIMPLPSAQAIPAETAARATKTPKRNTPVNFIRILP